MVVIYCFQLGLTEFITTKLGASSTDRISLNSKGTPTPKQSDCLAIL